MNSIIEEKRRHGAVTIAPCGRVSIIMPRAKGTSKGTSKGKNSEAEAAEIAQAEIEAAKSLGISKVETKKGTIISIPGVRIDTIRVLLMGTAPLLVHNFSEKARKKILDKQTGEASAGREKKDPIANFEASRYRLYDGTDGIPAGGLKACIVTGFGKASGVPMTQAKGAIRVKADDETASPPLVRIIHPIEPDYIAAEEHIIGEKHRIPACHEGMVRNETGVVDIRHRAIYWPWALFVEIEFLPTIASERQLLQAIAMSGVTQGQCEWRPGSKESKSGHLGTFELAKPEQIQAFAEDRLFADYKWPARSKRRLRAA
jgi:hypothetical protein